MEELSTGSSLGRYELLVRLGQGGMASVWVARDRSNGQAPLVAVKAMLPELAQHPEFRAMFLEEGQIVRSIEHPHVVRVHEVGEQRGTLFMVMDWVEGDSLRAVIREARRRRPIPPEMAVKIIADAAAGLHAAHELKGWDGELRNLVHCDVSPHNILVGLDGRAKIVDFGVANARLHSDVDSDDRVKGKFAYMSPEQARGEKVDRRSDVFSLGIVLYELTTGERLFRGDNPAHTLSLVLSGAVPDPRQLQADYPARLAEITLRALAPEVEERFQSAEAMRLALEQYLVDERILVSHSGVAKLVSRVLAPRTEALRQSLREALLARDADLPPELEAKAPAAAPSSSTSHAVAHTKHPSLFSNTEGPQTYEAPQPERTNWSPLFAAVGGVAAATASILWAMQRPVGSQLSVGAEPHAAPANQAVAARAEDSRGAELAPPDPGVELSSLPLAATTAVTAPPGVHRPLARGARGSRSAATVERSAPPEAEPHRVRPEGITLEEQAAPTAPKPSAAGAAASFNRGAAMAQLGSAAARATSCKRAGGPGGSGRATVTFAPDGTATRVNISAPFAGTPAGACLSSAFASTRVPAFTGSAVTLPWSFRIPE